MTKIEWLIDADGNKGQTWNPVTGCTKVSAGCKNCYAEGIANRFWGDRKFTDVQCHEDRLEQPLKRKKPTRYFVNSMSDLFHESVTWEFVDKVFEAMWACPQHVFMILTKRPFLMMEYIKQRQPITAPHIWLGVSVENQATADERITLLLQTPAAKRFVSYEPALGAVDITYPNTTYPKGPEYCCSGRDCGCGGHPIDPPLGYGLDLIIMGGESGPGYRTMHLSWARDMKHMCEEQNISFFFKQTAGKGPIPEDLQVREWPS